MYQKKIMRLVYLLGLVSFLLPNISHATTYVGEHIERDTRWLKANSPYVITIDLLVQKGATLEIEPGTKVYFSKETQMIIDGTVRAIGKGGKKILFSGLNDGNWNGFLFLKECGAYNEEDNSGTIFDNCVFKGTGEYPAHLIRSKGCNLKIVNCTIENVYTGIQTERQAHATVHKNAFKHCNRPLHVRNTSMAKVTNNKMMYCNSIMLGGTTTFSNNKLNKFTGKGTQSGLIIWMLGGGIIDIKNNTFKNFEGYAVKVQKMSKRSTFILKNNNFKNNETNLKLSCKYYNRGKSVVETNNFYNYKRYHVKLFAPCSDDDEQTLVIGANYWGKLSKDEIVNATFDHEKDEKINAKVSYEKILNKKSVPQ